MRRSITLGWIQEFSIHLPYHPSKSKIHNQQYKMTYQDDFVEKMVDQIHGRFFCIHCFEGSFYSEAYFHKWCEIAAKKPYTIFYSYVTDLPFAVKRPKNLILIYIGGRNHPDWVDNYITYEKSAITFACPRGDHPEVRCHGCMRCLGPNPVYMDFFYVSDLPSLLKGERFGNNFR